MNKNVKTALYIFAPMAVVVGIIIWVSRKKAIGQNTVGAVGPDGVAPVKLASTADSTSSYFPLQSGSNNSKVKELQQVLGVTADGIFGPVTQTALYNLTGSNVVASQADLTTLENAAKNSATASTNLSRATSLVNQFGQGGYNIMAITTSTYTQVIQDSSGALTPTGSAIQVTASRPLDNSDYKLTGTTKDGNVLIQCTTGANIGLYTADPSTLTLVAVGTTVPTTSTDDSDWLTGILSDF